MLGVALGAMSPSGNTKVLSLLAITQRLEARWPDSEGQRFDSQKNWSAKPLNGKQTWPTSCRPTTTTYVANHSGPLLLCTTGQTHRKFHYETQWYDWKRIFARRHWSERYIRTIFSDNMIFLCIYWKRCALERITLKKTTCTKTWVLLECPLSILCFSFLIGWISFLYIVKEG